MAKLATWRELSPAEQSTIREHAAECPSCLGRLTHYEQQDRLLVGLPEMASRVTFADVLDRTEAHRRPFAAQRGWAVALVLTLFLGLGAGAVAASGDAIPGDLLYPLKLSVETTRMWTAPDDAARDDLSARFAANRRIEVQALLSLNRSAEMDIAGSVTDVRGRDWTVSGMSVSVPHEIWQGQPPAPGQRIEMRVEIKAQEMRALHVRFAQQDGPVEGPGQPDPGPGTMPGDLVATPRGAAPPGRPAATTEQPARTAVPQPTATPVQAVTATHAAGTPSGSAATPAAGAPATETATAGSQPVPTESPELGPTGPSRTPTGPQGGQPGGGGR